MQQSRNKQEPTVNTVHEQSKTLIYVRAVHDKVLRSIRNLNILAQESLTNEHKHQLNMAHIISVEKFFDQIKKIWMKF